MRGIFELHIRCAKCGTNLNLVYDDDAERNNQKTTKATGTTGALKVEKSLFVEPCKVCLEPVERIQRALKDLGIK